MTSEITSTIDIKKVINTNIINRNTIVIASKYVKVALSKYTMSIDAHNNTGVTPAMQ